MPGRQGITRDGFIGLVKLEEKEKGAVIPHEKTLDKPKEDRLKLIEACSANFSAIFSLYSDPKNDIHRTLRGSITADPLLEVTDEEGTLHQLWRISQKDVSTHVTQQLRDRSLFIADGHHRYETARNYQAIQRGRRPQSSGNEALMIGNWAGSAGAEKRCGQAPLGY